MSASAVRRFKVQLEVLKYYYLIVDAESEETAEAIAERNLAELGVATGWIYLPDFDDSMVYNVEEEVPA